MRLELPKNEPSIIKVIGVGGGGSNAVTHMFKQGIVGVDFAICNTDNQALNQSPVPVKIRLGPTLTEGRGAGSKPQIGRQACLESLEDVNEFLSNGTKMLFVTAGMGGGTGTGAAPIIAKAAKDLDILTVGIVTLPFMFEGNKRTKQGFEGLDELKKNVDTLIVISNDKLRQIHGDLALSQAFSQADNILATAARGIAEIITVPGYVNVDFEDVNTVMRSSGVAIMGTAAVEGEDRARRAVDEALNSPLLEDSNIRGAQHILINITSGIKEATMDEVFEITQFVQEEAGYGTNLIWGNCFDERLGDKISVTVIATGFEQAKKNYFGEFDNENAGFNPNGTDARIKVHLDDDVNSNKRVFDIGFNDGDSSNTIEFDNIRINNDRSNRNRVSSQAPYVRPEDRDKILEEEQRRLREAEKLRKERIRNLNLNNVKLSNPQIINELENEPAYLRKNVRLDDVNHSSQSSISRYTISDDDDPEIRSNNSFLHDKAD
ncbi:MAG: cell division protein FtsZ [Saprospiraceae bacterium]